MAWGKLASVTSGTPVTNANITSITVFTPSDIHARGRISVLAEYTICKSYCLSENGSTDTIDTGNNYAFRYKRFN